MTALVQNPAYELSSRVLRHGSACLRNAPGQGVHLNDESCDDHANAFTAPALIGVKRKAGTSASEQFDTGNAVDINVLHRNRLDGRWREKKTLLHGWPPFVTGKSCQKKILRKHAAQHFARLNKISRNTIRDSVLALPSADRDRAVAVERNCSGPARPLTGFFENLQRGRIKNVPSWLMRKLRDALVEELQTEVQKLQHEIHLHRQVGEGPDSDAIFAAETRLAEAKKILGS